jgi:hypothetical protein
MDTIAFPIKFDGTGLAKHPEGSTDYYKHLLSLAILSEPRRHPFTPNFGINDPSFTNFDKGGFIIQAARYVPEIVITGIATEVNPEEDISVVFGFRMR